MAITDAEIDVTDSAAVGLSAPAGTKRVQVQPSVNVRTRFTGSDPTSSVGLRIVADALAEFSEVELRLARFRSESGAGKLRVVYYDQ